MTDDISATDSSKNRGLPATRRNGGEALRPTDAEGLARLWDYVKQHGTSQVPYRHKTTDGFLLGVWVTRRRKSRGENPALDQLLESMRGWTWAPHERGFEDRLAHYKDVAEAGNLNRHRALYVWASVQRQLVREGKMSADRLEQLRAADVI
jgi:Helicase associated domain